MSVLYVWYMYAYEEIRLRTHFFFGLKVAVSVQSVASLRGLAVRAMRYAPNGCGGWVKKFLGGCCRHACVLSKWFEQQCVAMRCIVKP